MLLDVGGGGRESAGKRVGVRECSERPNFFLIKKIGSAS